VRNGLLSPWSSLISQSGACLSLALLVLACASHGTSTQGGPITVSLSAPSVEAPQDGTPASVQVTVARASGDSNSVTLTVLGLPAGVTAKVTSPGAGSSGTITFTASSVAASGTSALTIQASDASSAGSAQLSLVVSIVAAIGMTENPNLGVSGKLSEFMSTSFQPAEWDYQFFQNLPEPATTSTLNNLGSQHIRLQFISQAVPMKASSTPPSPTDWDFTMLDSILQPVLSVADHSPELQIAVAPPLPGMLDTSGHLIVNSTNLSTFAAYCANLVRYYNTGGFDWGGQHFQSPSANKITWWGIFNEYNINGLTPSQYVQLYDTVVPAMLAVDPTIKFSALELSDFDYQQGDPRNNLPTFLAPPTSGGVSAQVNVLSTHFYSSCNQKDTDATVMGTIPGFVNDVKYFYTELQTRPDLAGVPVWVTENNVNADFSDANGNSTCNPGQKFVTDQRGTSAFFAAWRPYVFSQLGQAGNQALYHWDYDADPQYGEVDYSAGSIYLSYWVDFWLARFFPAPPGEDILNLNVTDISSVETLAVKEADGSVVVMVADRAIHSSTDNNGPGSPRTVVVDLSAWPAFSSASLLTIDANTSAASGPTATSVTPASRMEITLNGYGVAFLKLLP
jgi:hypothetical protein